MRTKVTHFQINSPYEEGPCEYCGWPMLYADRAAEANGYTYCSAKCAEDHHAQHPEWNAKDDAEYNAIVAARESAAADRAAEVPAQLAPLSFAHLADNVPTTRTLPGGQKTFI